MFVTDVREYQFTNIYPMVFYNSHEIYCLELPQLPFQFGKIWTSSQQNLGGLSPLKYVLNGSISHPFRMATYMYLHICPLLS